MKETQPLEQIFDPAKDEDLTKTALHLRERKVLKYSSEIGLLIALVDANTNNEKVFLLTKNLKITIINPSFKYKNDSAQTRNILV